MRRFLRAVLRRVDAAPSGIAHIAASHELLALGIEPRKRAFQGRGRIRLDHQGCTLRILAVLHQAQRPGAVFDTHGHAIDVDMLVNKQLVHLD